MIDKFNYQKEFAKKVIEAKGNKFPLTQEEKVSWTKEYILYIISECNDLLNQLNWKTHWSDDVPLIKDNVGIEIIDIQKFVWGLAQIWDISDEQFMELFEIKSAEVEAKWNQEQMKAALASRDKICVIDIDGVLTPYPDCFIKWAKLEYGVDLDQKIFATWELYKDLYRQSGAKRYLPVIESSKLALQKLKELGYTIVLLTNRPTYKYKRIYSDTLFWLRKNGIPFDYIFWNTDRKVLMVFQNKGIKFAVDDSADVCREFESYGFKTYQYNKDVNDLTEIEELRE